MSDVQPTVEDYQKRAEEYLAGWKRAMADYQNREKEIMRDREDMMVFATRGIITDLLPVLDNLKAAFAHIPEETKPSDWAQGLLHVIRQFEEMLKSYGVTVMTTVGELFDPMRHEAVGEETGENPGTILREVQAGYEINGKVLRVARVIIAK